MDLAELTTLRLGGPAPAVIEAATEDVLVDVVRIADEGGDPPLLVAGGSNLVVADASCFPTASGVNPMISIESIAYMNARRLADRLA